MMRPILSEQPNGRACSRCRAVRLLCALASIISMTLSFAPRAHAQDAATAVPSEDAQKRGRQFAIAGAKAYRAKNFQEALEEFKKEHTLYPSGQVWRMTVYTLMALERWVAAADALEWRASLSHGH